MLRLLLGLILLPLRPREATVPDTHEQRRTRLQARITDAWEQVQEARQAWAHSPNGDTVRAEQEACAYLDALLEEYGRMCVAEALVRQ